MPSSTAPESGTAAIAAEKYVSFTTFTKDGTPKPTPVWIAALPDGRVGFTTSIDSWKTKRIRNTPKVTLQPSDSRGRVPAGAVEVTGSAEVVQGSEFADVQARIKDKYGSWVTMVAAFNKVRGLFSTQSTASDCAIVITIE